MPDFTTGDVEKLCGSKPPGFGRRFPAAWWITTDNELLDGYDRWWSDYGIHREKIAVLAESIGLKVTDARLWEGFGSTSLSGFHPPDYMGHWNHDLPEYRPIPDGWRIDKKQNLLVPSRKTKKDRESQANKDFAAVAKVPDVNGYLTGMPPFIELDDRNFGGTMYFTRYHRGDSCLIAVSGGDPDRQPDDYRGKADIDDTIWHRQKLSILMQLKEKSDA